MKPKKATWRYVYQYSEPFLHRDRLLTSSPSHLRKPRLDITQDDVRDMIKLKAEGETYKAIGGMYGITDSAAYRRIKRFKEGQQRYE